MQDQETTKRVQVKVNRELSVRVEAILKQLGITQTTLINALYSRVAALGKVPFAMELTDKELAQLNLEDAVKDIPARTIENPEEFSKWLDED